ncbi:hypothetical protein MYX84_13595 [Acidobacteria bacterium AH-259-O06]|nr:hypothetical protein [Acidobacteria bacterium AH-259-O06]
MAKKSHSLRTSSALTLLTLVNDFHTSATEPLQDLVLGSDLADQRLLPVQEVLQQILNLQVEAAGLPVWALLGGRVRKKVRVAHEIEPYLPMWLEEPMRPENFDAMKKLSEHVTIPLASGYLDIPNKPGWGVELNEEAFRHMPPRPTVYREDGSVAWQ